MLRNYLCCIRQRNEGGQQSDKGPKIEGNKAVIEYVGGRDGNTYRAVLVYNPSTRQITVKSPVSVGASGGVKESFVVDGMVFTRR